MDYRQFSDLQSVGVNYDKSNSPFSTLRRPKSMMAVQKKRRTLDGENQSPKNIQVVECKDGIRQLQATAWKSLTNLEVYLAKDRE